MHPQIYFPACQYNIDRLLQLPQYNLEILIDFYFQEVVNTAHTSRSMNKYCFEVEMLAMIPLIFDTSVGCCPVPYDMKSNLLSPFNLITSFTLRQFFFFIFYPLSEDCSGKICKIKNYGKAYAFCACEARTCAYCLLIYYLIFLYWCKCTCQEKVTQFTFADTNRPI